MLIHQNYPKNRGEPETDSWSWSWKRSTLPTKGRHSKRMVTLRSPRWRGEHPPLPRYDNGDLRIMGPTSPLLSFFYITDAVLRDVGDLSVCGGMLTSVRSRSRMVSMKTVLSLLILFNSPCKATNLTDLQFISLKCILFICIRCGNHNLMNHIRIYSVFMFSRMTTCQME